MRHVLITSRVLSHPHGSVVSQERLGMDDEKLNDFIAHGYGIEFDMDEPPPAPPAPALAAVIAEAEQAEEPAAEPDEIPAAPDEPAEEPAPRPSRSRPSRRRSSGDDDGPSQD